MANQVNSARDIYNAVASAMEREDLLPPDFRNVSIIAIVAAMMVLVERMADSAELILQYLYRHGCTCDEAVLRFLFDQFTGPDPDHSLWWRKPSGHYTLHRWFGDDVIM